MKRLTVIIAAVCSLVGSIPAAGTSDNVAYKDGHVRFTLVSPGSVRLEYSPDGKFIDGKTLLAVDREYAPVAYNLKTGGKFIEIRTDLITVRYRKGTGAFTSENLSIAASKSNPFQFCWKPGMVQKENLKGTRHGYDAVKGRTVMYGKEEGKTVELDDGILARDGWTLIDDSKGPVLVKDGDCQLHPITEEWIENRPDNGSQDWYFLSYGHDYQSALKDFTSFSGPIPMLPRYAYGNWHSWYWLYSDGEFREMMDNYRKYGIPVDVLCIDMDRHINGWYGWDWNLNLFPDPAKMFADFHADHLKLTTNMHIDYLYSNESSFAPMKKDLGAELAPGDTITLELSDRKIAGSFFKREIDKMYGLGWDFLWDDNGSYVSPPGFPSIDMNLWRGHLFFEDNAARGKRPLFLGRYGGFGGHRYPVGFSGDTFAAWESLEFQTIYNTSSANVCFLWTHDLGGFQNEWWDPEKPFAQTAKYDPELLLRWLQFGALTPAMRNQTAKQISICKYPWEQPRDYFEPIREAVRLHYALNPYIYSMSRKAYETGVSVCRPLYYEWPESEEAYARKNEYMFGDNIFVAPITAPKGESRLSHLKFWLPEGLWYEWATGTMLEGGKEYERTYALNEYPMFVKAGAIIPMYDGTQTNLDGCDEAITIVIAPGEGDNRFSLYEDDGVDPDYAHNFAKTEITSSRRGNIHKIVIGGRRGSYRNMPSDRNFRIKLLSAACPASVTVNGEVAEWSFDGMDIAVLVDVPQTLCDAEKVVEIEYSENSAVLNGLKGAAKRSYEAIYDLKRNNEDFTYFFPDYMARVYTIREALYYHPEKMDELVDRFWKEYGSVIDRISAIPLKPAYIERYKSFFE